MAAYAGGMPKLQPLVGLLTLALNVAAMLISFLALIALTNALLGLAGLSLQQIFG